MMGCLPLVIPVFRKLKPQAATREQKPGAWGQGRPRSIPDSVVAAIRWDYDCGLMRMRELKAKWAGAASASTIENVAYGSVRPEVRAAKGQP